MIDSREIKDLNIKVQDKYFEFKKLFDLKKEELAKKFNVSNFDIIITSTLRDNEKQLQIYKQGRELTNGSYVVVDKSKVVSNAKPGTSFHNYGLAFDFAVKINGKITWDVKYYIEVGKIGKEVGLEYGGDWINFKDYPHFQYSYSDTLKRKLTIMELSKGVII